MFGSKKRKARKDAERIRLVKEGQSRPPETRPATPSPRYESDYGDSPVRGSMRGLNHPPLPRARDGHVPRGF